MGNILVATLGMSPGVVTKTAHHIQKEKGIALESVAVVYPQHPDIIRGIQDVLMPEFRHGRTDAKLSKVELLCEGITQMAATDIKNWEPDMKAFIKHFIDVLTKYRSKARDENKLFVSISGGRKTMTYAASFVIETLLAAEMPIDGIFHVTIDEEEGSGYTFQKMWGATPAELEPKLYPKDAKVLELPRRLGQRVKLVDGKLEEIEIDVRTADGTVTLPYPISHPFSTF